MFPIRFRHNPLNPLTHFHRMFEDLASELDRTVHSYGMPTIKGLDQPSFVPNMDIVEKDKEYNMTIEVAGIPKENIKVTIDDNTLVINGHKENKYNSKTEDVHVQECYYGSFRREVRIPSNVNKEKTYIKYNDGMLEISLLKQEENKTPVKELKIN